MSDQKDFTKWIDEHKAEGVRTVWNALKSLVKDLPLPAVTDGEKYYLLTWSRPQFLLELDLESSSGESGEWYARDRIADKSEHGIWHLHNRNNSDFISWLSKISAAYLNDPLKKDLSISKTSAFSFIQRFTDSHK